MTTGWYARLLALKSFETHQAGDIVVVVLNERWAHLIANDYMRLVDRWPISPTPYESTNSR